MRTAFGHNLFLFCVGFCFMVIAGVVCKAPREAQGSANQPDLVQSYVLSYDRGPCFGECPVYTFYLLSDHTGLIHVKANFLEPGWYQADLDEEELHALLGNLSSSAIWAEDLSDEPEIADLPEQTLRFLDHDAWQQLTVQSRISGEMSQTFQSIHHLVQNAIWSPTVIRPAEQIEEPLTDVIVQLKPGIAIQEWLQKFDRFGIQLVRRLSPRQSYYVVRKEVDKGHPNDFLQYIRQDPDVVEAQWDRQLTSRERERH